MEHLLAILLYIIPAYAQLNNIANEGHHKGRRLNMPSALLVALLAETEPSSTVIERSPSPANGADFQP